LNQGAAAPISIVLRRFDPVRSQRRCVFSIPTSANGLIVALPTDTSTSDVEQVFAEAAVRHVEHRASRVRRLAARRRQIDVDAPRVRERLTIRWWASRRSSTARPVVRQRAIL
jgi:hypothetical protein